MMLVNRMFVYENKTINIQQLQQDHKIMMILMYKAVNVKDVDPDVIVNVPAKVPWVSQVCLRTKSDHSIEQINDQFFIFNRSSRFSWHSW